MFEKNENFNFTDMIKFNLLVQHSGHGDPFPH